MSHVVASKVYVADLTDAQAVGASLGFELCRDATTFAWYGSWQNDFSGATAAVSNGYDPKDFGKCEHKLRRVDHQAGMYEIGLVRRADGKPGWELMYDNWSTGGKAIEAKAGTGLREFKKGLAERGFHRGLERGYRVTRTVDAKTGAIELRATAR